MVKTNVVLLTLIVKNILLYVKYKKKFSRKRKHTKTMQIQWFKRDDSQEDPKSSRRGYNILSQIGFFNAFLA